MVLTLSVLYVIIGVWLGIKYYTETGYAIRSILLGIFWFLVLVMQDDPVKQERDKFYLKCRYCFYP